MSVRTLARDDRAVVLLLVLVAAALRLPTLGLQSYWYDEAVTADLVDRGLVPMFHGIARTESTPPLYYLLAWIWARLFGSGAVALRTLSALFGIALVPVAFAAGRTLVSRRAGIATAALAATSPVLVWYSQEARSYSLLALLAGASVVLFERARREPTTRRVWSWAVVSALAVATHYFAAFMVLPEAAWLLVAHRRARRVVAGSAFVAAMVAALLPLVAVQTSHGRLGWIRDMSLLFRMGEAIRRLLIPSPAPPWAGALEVHLGSYRWVGALALLLLAGVALTVRGSIRERQGATVAIVLAATGFALPVAVSLLAHGLDHGRGDVFLDRNLLMIWVPLNVFVASGLTVRRLGLAGAGAVALLCVASGTYTVSVFARPDQQRDDWRAVDRRLGHSPGAVVVYPEFQGVALRRQRPDLRPLPRHGRRVARLTVVLVGFHGAPATLAVPAGFARLPNEKVQDFTLLRYAASAPALVTRALLTRGPVAGSDLAILGSRP